MQGPLLPPPASTLARPSLAAPLARTFPPSAPLSFPRADREKEGSSLLTRKVRKVGSAPARRLRSLRSPPPRDDIWRKTELAYDHINPFLPSIGAVERLENWSNCSFIFSFPPSGGRTAPKKCYRQTHTVGLDRGTRSRRGTYHGTGTYCGTGEGACGILKVWKGMWNSKSMEFQGEGSRLGISVFIGTIGTEGNTYCTYSKGESG